MAGSSYVVQPANARFYRLAATRHLFDTGRWLKVVLEFPSQEGVRAGIRNGFGVGLFNQRNITEGLEVLEPDLAPLPQVCHVLRSLKAVPSKAECNLTDAILPEMQEET